MFALRILALYAFVGAIMIAALQPRRWFWGLCGLLFLTVVMQHPSMPKHIGGLQGLNPWNLTLVVIIIGWAVNRGHDPIRAPASPILVTIFSIYVLLVIATGLVAVGDCGSFQGPYRASFISRTVTVDTLINPLKFIVAAALFFDSTTTRARVKLTLFSAVSSALCYSLLMFKSINKRIFTIDFEDARHLTDKLIGLFANDMAKVLVFGFWGAVFLYFLLDNRWQRFGWLFATIASIPTFVVLKSRAGFLACIMIGLVLGVLRWRRILVAFPIVALTVLLLFPSVKDRVMMGVASDEVEESDWGTISAGRTTYLWPPALEQIAKSPLIGHGRYAILRTDCYTRVLDLQYSRLDKLKEGRVPQHPHCMYLEILLDAGIAGLVICLTAAAGIVIACLSLMRVRGDRLISTLGTVGLIACVSELTAGATGSSFYATQSLMPCLAVWAAVLRVRTEMRHRAVRPVVAARPVPASAEREMAPAYRQPQAPPVRVAPGRTLPRSGRKVDA